MMGITLISKIIYNLVQKSQTKVLVRRVIVTLENQITNHSNKWNKKEKMRKLNLTITKAQSNNYFSRSLLSKTPLKMIMRMSKNLNLQLKTKRKQSCNINLTKTISWLNKNSFRVTITMKRVRHLSWNSHYLNKLVKEVIESGQELALLSGC